MLTLEVKNLTTSYGKLSIKKYHFKLEEGDNLACRRSGAGKTTIIETLAGLKKPKKGRINAYIDDKARHQGFDWLFSAKYFSI
jgi:ABC-type sugar transport system ATPase subunit